MELGKKRTQSQKDKYNMHSLIADIKHKAKDNQPTVHNSREPRQQTELQKSHTWTHLPRRKRKDLLSKLGMR